MSSKRTRTKGQKLLERPPVVVVLGHVDHGKTTLLDTIRKTNVVARESGGITQHVGAYRVEHSGKTLTVLDTPGHAAFSEMRSRGAKVADVAILVVAADDGVQPQTKEALEAIRTAEIPFVVAINKIDKNNADIERTKNELTENGVLLEGWGGDVPNVEISAKKGEGVEALLDLVALVAEMAELSSDDSASAEGVVVESHQDARRGPVATLLVQQGILRVGDTMTVGSVSGKLKAMSDFTGANIQEAGPSIPAVVLGINGVADVGDRFTVVPDERTAEELAQAEASRRNFERRIADGTPFATFVFLLRADVTGSLEAIVGELEKLRNSIVAIELIGAETGALNESDIKRAASVGATVYGFRVKAPQSIMALAERSGVPVKTFDIIYELLDSVVAACRERLPRQLVRDEVGAVKLLGVFRYDAPQQIIGGLVTKGIARKQVKFEIVRQEAVVGRGTVLEVQRQKIVIDEAAQNEECGLKVKFASGGPAEVGDSVRLFIERDTTPDPFSQKT